MSMHKIAIAAGVGLLMVAGATGHSDLPERSLSSGATPISYDRSLRLSESQQQALQAQFKYWRAQTDDYAEFSTPH